jgi:hypothetical protein
MEQQMCANETVAPRTKNSNVAIPVDMPRLTPAQAIAYELLKQALKAGGLLLLTSHSGRGRTIPRSFATFDTRPAAASSPLKSSSKVRARDTRYRWKKRFTRPSPPHWTSTMLSMWMT